MKKSSLWLVVLIVLSVFIAGCLEKSPLTKEELKDLPSDDPVLIMSEEKALTGQGYAQLTSPQKQAFWNCWKVECYSLLKEAQQTKDYSAYRQCSLGCFDKAQTSTENIWCEDSDGTDFLTKGIVTSNLYANGKEDYCYTFPSGKTYLMEGKCVNNKYQYQQKNCAELGGNYICKEGACVTVIAGMDSNFIENKGTLDCQNILNKIFCHSFNSGNKYYGFGTHNLSVGDFVIVEPFIFKLDVDFGWLPVLKVLWVDNKGNIMFVDRLEYSLYADKINLIANFQGIYVYTKPSGVSLDKPISFVFSSQCIDLLEWCKTNGVDKCEYRCSFEPTQDELTYETKNVISFAANNLQEYNLYVTKSLQICLEEVSSYLGINPPTNPLYSRVAKVNDGGGCFEGHFSILCLNTLDFVDSVFNTWDYDSLIDKGNCVDFNAQPHEITHFLIEGTPIQMSNVLNEGLAQYTGYKVGDTSPKIECLEDGYVIGYSQEESYYNLSEIKNYGAMYDTAACVWDYIDTTYGHDKFIEIMKKMESLRYKPGIYKIFEEIINPIIGEDVLPELGNRFGLKEVIVVKEI